MSVGLWCASVEHRDGGRRRRWSSCGFVPMDREWRRTSARTWLRDQSHRVTRRGGWHLGHTHASTWQSGACCRCGWGLVGHVSRTCGTRCDTHGGLVVEPQKTTQRYGRRVFDRVWSQNSAVAVLLGIGGNTWRHHGGCVEEKQLRVECVAIR
jgi:hypothetical protein